MEMKPGLLKEQQVLLIAEPSLSFFFFKGGIKCIFHVSEYS
ncbi:rCG63393 [Rattus norvegicus]|uniref:RCG63393 n=1 Tax=Rattus norvegicus TaxID=10116 RepID=A6JF19_RAT|nr:rCG63393 [Rattus norvegicus]